MTNDWGILAYHRTSVNPPPPHGWIWGLYGDDIQNPIMLITCFKGCCVSEAKMSSDGTMKLPDYWKFASNNEIKVHTEKGVKDDNL